MTKYIVQMKPSAEEDITNRYHQIKESSEKDALHWYLTIIQAIETLDQLATRCPVAPESEYVIADIRHLVIGHYRVLFSIEDVDVHILHVRHSAMNRANTLQEEYEDKLLSDLSNTRMDQDDGKRYSHKEAWKKK